MPPVAGPSPLVGRAEELAALDAALAGEAPGLALVGDPGIGKSRLLDELAARGAALRHVVLGGRASEFEQDLPFAVWRQALDDPVLEAAARDAGPGALDELAVLRSALRPDERASSSLLAAERHRLYDAVRALLGVLAADRPLVLLLDDLHWADEASAELVLSLLLRPPRGRVLLALALRPRPLRERLAAALDRAVRDHGLLRLEVGPLDATAADALIGSQLAPEVRAQLREDSGGNPLFLEQLARARQVNAAGGRLPRSISAALGDELRRLPATAATVLQGAAVVGDPFDVDLVAAAAATDEATVLEAVDGLLAADLIRPTDVPRRFSARHPLVRQVVAEQTGAGWTIAAHERVVAALTARGAPPDQLAHHVARCARPGDIASAGLLEAAAATVLARAPAVAVDWLQAARGVLEATTTDRAALVRVLRLLATALGVIGRSEDSRAALAAALELPLARSERVELSIACAAVEQRLGRQRDSRARLEQALTLVGDEPSRERCGVLLELASNACFGNDLEAAMIWGRRCADEADAVGDAAGAMGGRAVAAFVRTVLGDTAAARVDTLAAAVACDALSAADLQQRPEVLFFLCGAELYLEQFEPLVARARRGIQAARAGGRGAALAPLQLHLGFGLLLVGQVAEGRAVLEHAAEGARLAGSPFDQAWVLLNLTWAGVLAGDFPAALRTSDEALDLSAALDDQFVHGYVRGARAFLLLEAGNAAGALDALADQGHGAVPDLVPGSWGVQMLEVQCRAELALGRAEAAAHTAQITVARAQALGLHAPLGWAARARGHVQLAAGDAEGAAASAEQAAADFAAIGMPVEAAVARCLQGRALAASGARSAAVAVLTEAVEAAVAAGAEGVRATVARELRRLGRRPPRPAPGAGDLSSLSTREREVADLVADGLRNVDIAAALYVTPKTVESHLRSIFGKLAVSSRVEIATAVQRERNQ